MFEYQTQVLGPAEKALQQSSPLLSSAGVQAVKLLKSRFPSGLRRGEDKEAAVKVIRSRRQQYETMDYGWTATPASDPSERKE